MIKKLTCIECPLGCEIEVEVDGENIKSVTGNTCPRGKRYAINEITCPKRVITSTVRLVSGGVVPVKTSQPVSKANLFDVMERVNEIKCFDSVKIGDIILKDIEPGVDLIATANA